MAARRLRLVTWAVVLVAAAGLSTKGFLVQRRSQAIARYMDAAEAAHHAGNMDGAVSNYKRVLVLDARCLPARTGLADSYVNLGQTEQALREHQRGVAADPRNPDAHIALARGLIECRRYGEAEQCLRRGIQAAPREAYLHQLLLYVCRREGETDKARRELIALRKIAPGSEGLKSAERAMRWDAVRANPRKDRQPASAAGANPRQVSPPKRAASPSSAAPAR
jgi:Flp pilus assembly protein TadD